VRQPSPRRALGLEGRAAALAMGLSGPATVLAVALLWRGDLEPGLRWTAAGTLLVLWVSLGLALRSQLAHPLRTLANLLESLRTGDYSIRARARHRGGALGAVHDELHRMAAQLQEQRLGSLEAAALVRQVMAEIDLAVLTFDPGRRLHQVNPAGERLLGRKADELLGQPAGSLGLADLLEGPTERTVERVFGERPSGERRGRWQVRRGSFREGGAPHHLLVVANLSRALRSEQRLAWQRLVRVLSHEINNSLTPIRSMASTLVGLVPGAPDDETNEDLRRGLEVVERRARALSEFVAAYARLARLPPPQLESVSVAALVRDVAALEHRRAAKLRPGPDLEVLGDRGQLEQLLINLLRNAVDAVGESAAPVSIGWRREGDQVAIEIEDEGPGLPESANLFVPFFTTKPGGSGIGLALCRQIADAHDAELTVENRTAGPGCTAVLRIAVASSADGAFAG
jgi:nitrogen fixation/metabolism regulation signal transduction histidine kinase